MISETCPRCREPLTLSTLAETLRECPKCRETFQGRDSQAVALLTRTGENQAPRPRALIALTPEFSSRYRLIRVVGAGAMGTVVEAADVRNGNQPVAVKFLMRLNSAAILERFVREVRALSNLDHPTILRMFDSGQLDGHPYVVTEYLGGGTLRDKIKKQRVIPLEETIGIASALLSGLSACHAAGLVHRDVKPENVLFGADGRPRLADLGLAKEEGGAELTEDGVALGTPLYMSPEQVQGIAVGPGSDIYSVALIMYEMLTGRHPFIAPRLANILDHHLRTMPRPIHEVAPHLSAELSEVLRQALVKRLEDRTGDAAAMAEQLQAVLRGAGAEETRGAVPAVRRAPESGAAVAVPRAPAGAAPAIAPASTGASATAADLPAPRGRASSRKERAVPRTGDRREAASPPASTAARGFVALPLWVRIATAVAPFLALGFLAFRSPGGGPPVAVSSSASRSLPPFLIAKSPSPSVAPSAVATPVRDAGGAGGGGGLPLAASPAEVADVSDMVQIPGGTFTMGSPESFAMDAKAHEVRVRTFYIDRNEVTNERFARFCDAKKYTTEAEKRGTGLVWNGKELVEVAGADWRHPRGPADTIEGFSDRPVAQVTWQDAFTFATWARKRLPTEAEWERAARGSARGNYPWGDEPPEGRACVTRPEPCAVGGFPANDFGVRDVLGSVREWCSDWYAADFYTTPAASTDPIGPDGGRSRVIRGGSFLSPHEELTLSARREAWPNVAAQDLGFRTARDGSR